MSKRKNTNEDDDDKIGKRNRFDDENNLDLFNDYDPDTDPTAMFNPDILYNDAEENQILNNNGNDKRVNIDESINTATNYPSSEYYSHGRESSREGSANSANERAQEIAFANTGIAHIPPPQGQEFESDVNKILNSEWRKKDRTKKKGGKKHKTYCKKSNRKSRKSKKSRKYRKK